MSSNIETNMVVSLDQKKVGRRQLRTLNGHAALDELASGRSFLKKFSSMVDVC